MGNKKIRNITIIFLIFFLVSIKFVYANEGFKDLSVSINTSWNSKYFSEGRNNLNDGGMFVIGSNFGLNGFSIGSWLGIGDTEDYQELQMFIQYGKKISNFDLYIQYQRLRFFKSKKNDNELGVGIAYSKYPLLLPSIDYVYSTESEGAYLYCTVKSNINITENFSFSPYLLEGIDLGYASQKYDGFNNFQIGIEAIFSLTNKINLNSSIAYSWAQEDVNRTNGKDQFWGNVGVSFEF
ncbi:MAG: hypothetical protein U9R41_06630 [Candidatus Marinimicrobia bacterium]|nr:hypothetical protein [Candidatus Neomarinimicrobiota bacterium]